MKIRTENAIGPALDFLVAKIQCEPIAHDPMFFGAESSEGGYWVWNDRAGRCMKIGREYSPSTKWTQGGPIIERERIRLDCPWGDRWDAEAPTKRRAAKLDGTTGWLCGPTALVAAMRCYVMANYGDEVDIPEELV